MDLAKAGKDALEAGQYTLAVDLYTSAIRSSPTAVDYYIQRSIAFTRLKESDNDPAAPSTPNYQSALKDTETAVLLAYKRQKKELIQRSQLRRAIALANLNRLGDADFVLKICRTLHGPATYKKPETDNPTLELWEKRVQVKMAKLSPDDEQLKVTVTEKPEEHLETAIKAATIETEQKDAADKVKARQETIKAGVTQDAKDIRHDFYQSSENVTLTVYAKFVPKESVVHEIKEDSIMVTFPDAKGEQYTLTIDPLFAKVDIAKSKLAVLRNGIEFKLKKAVSGKWPGLHGSLVDDTSSVYSRPISGTTPTVSDSKSDNDTSSLLSPGPTTVRPASDPIPPKSSSLEPTPSRPTPKGPVYPTSSKSGPKDWDKIADESLHPKKAEKKSTKGKDSAPAEEDEESDDGGGGDGVDKFFRKLYKGADDETRRAMMKSFTESEGTALSTNWKEVSKGKVEAKPPSDD